MKELREVKKPKEVPVWYKNWRFLLPATVCLIMFIALVTGIVMQYIESKQTKIESEISLEGNEVITFDTDASRFDYDYNEFEGDAEVGVYSNSTKNDLLNGYKDEYWVEAIITVDDFNLEMSDGSGDYLTADEYTFEFYYINDEDGFVSSIYGLNQIAYGAYLSTTEGTMSSDLMMNEQVFIDSEIDYTVSNFFFEDLHTTGNIKSYKGSDVVSYKVQSSVVDVWEEEIYKYLIDRVSSALHTEGYSFAGGGWYYEAWGTVKKGYTFTFLVR